ncbi:uncharacterized protein [Aristolochia californica]|uniref:uncharacterized protein isoform X2 n=1 Tax=Aristolochia californica TaxID=171875 RepID=UPI0035DBB0F1
MAAQQIFFGEAPESLPPTSYSVVADQANAGWTAVSAMKQNWIGHKLRIDGLRRTSEKQKESGSLGESFFANVAEDFIGRARKLESDLLSEAELDWAQAKNRHAEKLEDEAEMFEDGLYIPRPRRGLILNPQLVQQLLRALPAAILSADATSEYETDILCC